MEGWLQLKLYLNFFHCRQQGPRVRGADQRPARANGDPASVQQVRDYQHATVPSCAGSWLLTTNILAAGGSGM
jgi:hypothetical protein